MISLVVVPTIIKIDSDFLQINNKSVFIALLVPDAFFIACILLTRFGIKSVENMFMTWTADSLPVNWTELRDQWWSLHIMRTIAELTAFFLVKWTSIKRD